MAGPQSSATATESRKRKQPTSQSSQTQPDLPSRKRRRVKAQDARVIAAQTTGKAFADGEINVDKFVQAREFEIAALEDGMRRAKKTLSARAFQNVPKDLRRRTASHDVKRVPKRLRARAAKEMAEDNTPTGKARRKKPSSHDRLRTETVKRLKALGAKGKRKEDLGHEKGPVTKKEGAVGLRVPRVKKNTLQKPSKPKARFRKRQIHKSWLPTHLFHAKRAHMTPPKEPLWRMAIPLSPTSKSYRPTHRASSLRGAVAWDMSYMSTIGLQGAEASIKGLLGALGVGAEEPRDFSDRDSSRWIAGRRFWEGWVYERNGWSTKSIAPVAVIWCVKDNLSEVGNADSNAPQKKRKRETRKAFIRVHPSAFLQLWEEILRLSKVQKPSVTVEDLRFEIGSIEITGPASTEVLVNVLRPANDIQGTEKSDEDLPNIWSRLASLENPGSLPKHALINMDISDPRLQHRARSKHDKPPEPDPALFQILATWPVDRLKMSARVFDRASRMAACRQMPSQKAINRRRTLAGPGGLPEQRPSDPKIPILLMASRNNTNSQGNWSLLLPWKYVLPVWYSLMYFPISTGGTMRFGGLDEKRQVLFESKIPWFPGDYPGTRAGREWELQEQERRKREWARRPKGKRIEWDSVDLGHAEKGEVGMGWACDWQRLARGIFEAGEDGHAEVPFHRIPPSLALSKFSSKHDGEEHTIGKDGGLATIILNMWNRGVPTTCARIYRLPSNSKELREEWLALATSPSTATGKKRTQNGRKPIPKDAPTHIRRQLLAASLLNGPDPPQPGHPRVPDENDLIGYVTTGNFDLGLGKGTGVGCILLDKALERTKEVESAGSFHRERQLCIVREAGQAHGRLARWEIAKP